MHVSRFWFTVGKGIKETAGLKMLNKQVFLFRKVELDQQLMQNECVCVCVEGGFHDKNQNNNLNHSSSLTLR